jgi:hypothetical protein
LNSTDPAIKTDQICNERQGFSGDIIGAHEPDRKPRSDDKRHKKKKKKNSKMSSKPGMSKNKKSKMSKTPDKPRMPKKTKKTDEIDPEQRELVNLQGTQVADKSAEVEQPNEKREIDERRRLDAIVASHVDGNRCVYDRSDTSSTGSKYFMSGGIVTGPLGGSKGFAPCSKLPDDCQTSQSSAASDLEAADKTAEQQHSGDSSFSSSSVLTSCGRGKHDFDDAKFDQSVLTQRKIQLLQVSVSVFSFCSTRS